MQYQKSQHQYGRGTQQIIRSVNRTGERPEETLRIFNFLVIGKKTLGFKLTDVEVAYLAATGFTGSMNSAGFDCYIESPEADLWPEFRNLLCVAAAHHLPQFDRAMGITGVNFSTDRQIRKSQLEAGGESIQAELEELDSNYYEESYPNEAEIENFLGREDVVVITDEQLEMADEIARLNSP
jgi:hypothetical protein